MNYWIATGLGLHDIASHVAITLIYALSHVLYNYDNNSFRLGSMPEVYSWS